MAKTGILLSVIAATFFLSPLSAIFAQEDRGLQASTVIEVRVSGNRRLSRSAVLAGVKTRVGQDFDEEIARADVQRLLDGRRFSAVKVTKIRTPRGVIVTFEVTERPTVARVAFVGNKAYKDSQLAKELTFAAGDPLSRSAVVVGKQALLSKYRSDGYADATITVDPEELDKRNVIYRIVEGPKVSIRKLRFEGNRHFSNFRLRMTIGLSKRFWPFVPGNFDREQMQRDVNAIRNLYVSEGFLDVEVGARPEMSPDRRKVALTFVIRENQRYRINKVIFRGNRAFSGAELAKRLNLRRGKFFSSLALQRDTREIRNTCGKLGYIDANVTARKIFVDPTAPLPAWVQTVAKKGEKPALLNLLFDITEGGQYRFGGIVIRGNTTTQDRVIRRQLKFFPEQLFDTTAVERARRRLLESGLFEKVDIIPTGQSPGERDVLVKISEGRTAMFLVGAGVSSNAGILGNISFKQRNFDILGWPRSRREFLSGQAFKGAGQTLSIVAEPGTELMRFHVEWTEPYLFDQPYSLGLKSFLFTRGRESYDEMRYGCVASVGHRFRNRWYGELSGRIEGVKIDDLDEDAPPEVSKDEGTHALLGLKGTLVRDRTDSRWRPTTGDRFRLSYEQVAGGFQFGRGVAEYRIYRTLYTDALERKHILAGRFSVGHIFGDAPVFERFYGGGTGSIRGFAYRGISPRSAGTDEAIGGESMIFAGGEYSFPLIGKPREGGLRGVVFLDTGTVEEEFKLTTYRVSAGFGVRWTVKVFGPVPIALDFGFPLNKSDEDDTQVFSFSMRWSF